MKRIIHIWQILTGIVAIIALSLVIIWLVRGVASQPPAFAVIEVGPTASALPGDTPTPEITPTLTSKPELPTHDWHGTKVILAVDFPQIPVEASIYTHSTDVPATIKSAQKLAQRFGVNGDVYQDTNGSTAVKSLMVTDGKQRLSMISNGQFSYSANFSMASQEEAVSTDIASGAIDSFLKTHGFDFSYQLQAATGIGAGWFYVIPLTLDGRPLRFDFGRMQGLNVHVSPDGKIISLDAFLLNLNPKPVGNFGLISAGQAWQKFLQDAPIGMIQSSHSGGAASGRLFWHHIYPDNQPVTIYGYIASFTSVESGKSPFITVDGFMANGNTSGMEALTNNTFAQVRGQFATDNGIRKFTVESWKLDPANQQNMQGSLRSETGKTVFVSPETSYVLADAPADLPLPLENVSIFGMVNGTELNWQDMLYYKNPNQGGGGGCGGGFAKLNFDGSPVPWPMPTPIVTPTGFPTGQHIDNLRGMLSVSIYEQTDGTKRTEYNLFTHDTQYALQGSDLEKLSEYHNRQVIVSGTVSGYTQFQIPILTVEKYDIPNPDLKFQILRGKQKTSSVDGQSVTLFTSQDGTTYAQMMPAGILDNNLVGVQGDLVMYEVLIYPDETFGAYPVMRIFSGQMATNPKTGLPVEMEIRADQPNVMPEPLPISGSAPTLTIDSIELVYYTPDPNYAASYPEAMSPYIQPAWRFSGHFSDGSETEILIQALKQDFLLPESAPAVQCG